MKCLVKVSLVSTLATLASAKFRKSGNFAKAAFCKQTKTAYHKNRVLKPKLLVKPIKYLINCLCKYDKIFPKNLIRKWGFVKYKQKYSFTK